MPQPLKPLQFRRRRNKASTRKVLTAPILKRIPRLPKPEGVVWRSETREWWRDVWQSLMATEFEPADRWGLVQLAVLINKFWEKPGPTLAAEIRQREACYGLSPLSRCRLEWTIEHPAQREFQKLQKAIETGDPRELLRGGGND